MGLMGLIGPMGLMGLIGPIGLIGLIGPMSLPLFLKEILYQLAAFLFEDAASNVCFGV